MEYFKLKNVESEQKPLTNFWLISCRSLVVLDKYFDYRHNLEAWNKLVQSLDTIFALTYM